jgi:hypothetical protein
METNVNLRMFDRLVLEGFDPKSQDFLLIQPKGDGTHGTQLIENTGRMSFPVVQAMVKAILRLA